MSNFIDRWKSVNWQNVDKMIKNQTKEEVERALTSNSIGLNEMLALLSPIALKYIEFLAQKAKYLTRLRFGNNVNLYTPLYLSNECTNNCTYCGFSKKNRINRKILNKQEILNECDEIKNNGIDNILLVTGEHKNKVGIDYFCECISLIRNKFSLLTIEVQPLLQNEYIKLKNLGLDGVLVYQETYHMPTYHTYHLQGKKRDFFWRLETPDRLGRAEIEKIGLGVLIGLSNNWQADCYMMAEHLIYMRHKYWKSSYSVSFPRIRPYFGSNLSILPNLISEAQLLQIMCAFRILAPEVEISLSTRESAHFRDHAMYITVNNISVGSKTQPGGYFNKSKELAQFLTYDNRSVKDIEKSISKMKLQPLWKDWDYYLGHIPTKK